MNSDFEDELEFEIDPLSDNTIATLKEGAYSQLPDVIVDATEETKQDIEFSRARIRKAMDIGSAVLESAKELAIASEDPKTIVAVSRLIDSISSASDKLVRLEQKTSKPAGDKERETHQHLYIGSPSELQKMLNNK